MSEYQKVLVVDDDDLIRMMLVRHLENEGYLVISGEDGEEGLQLVREHRPAVLVLDLAMPVKNGMEMLNEMTPAEMEDTSVIVLTGHGGEDDLEECYRLGVRSFLNKPVNFYALLGVVKHAFQLQETRRELISTNQRMHSILTNIPDIVLEVGGNREIRFANDKVESLLGYVPEKIVGSSLKEFIHQDDLTKFEFRFSEGISLSSSALKNLNVRLIHHDGHSIPFQVSANPIAEEGEETRYVAIARDASEMEMMGQGISELVDDMTIQIKPDLTILDPGESVIKLFGHLFAGESRRISEFISDDTMLPLFEYSFDQQEDLPFPAEVALPDKTGKTKLFSVQFVYKDPFLEGVLCPTDSSSQMVLMSGKMEAQSEALNSAVMVDPEMSAEILADCDNLIVELLGILKKLEPFLVREEIRFVLDDYRENSKGKNFQEYQEQLRFLSNKLHSLKGSSGFLIPAAKTLCHTAEGITGGLKELKLVYTDRVAGLLKQFIFKIQEFLEMYQENPEQNYEIAEWTEKIETALSHAENYIEKDVLDFAMFIKERATDNGEVRIRKTMEYLTVSKNGYFDLAKKVQNIYYTLAYYVPDDEVVKAGTLYNEFLAVHQEIKKVPLDLSRYERLIPSIAAEYGKKADFIFLDHGVNADMEFWNALHEILNHSLKNAVIHGIEQPEERLALEKDETGRVTVEVYEDALNIFVTIMDDGRGLNEEKIKQKALESGVVSEGKIESMNSSEIFNLVFLQGVSTAEQLDDNAGRGVGLNAVQEAMSKFRGVCEISSIAERGATWQYTFPKSSVSISSYVLSFNDYKLAVPEENIVYFQKYVEKEIQYVNGVPTYSFQGNLVPVIELGEKLDVSLEVNHEKMRRLLILNASGKKMALVINDIIHHETLPVFPLPDDYKKLKQYTGLTMYSGEPVLMLNVQYFQGSYDQSALYS